MKLTVLGMLLLASLPAHEPTHPYPSQEGTGQSSPPGRGRGGFRVALRARSPGWSPLRGTKFWPALIRRCALQHHRDQIKFGTRRRKRKIIAHGPDATAILLNRTASDAYQPQIP